MTWTMKRMLHFFSSSGQLRACDYRATGSLLKHGHILALPIRISFVSEEMKHIGRANGGDWHAQLAWSAFRWLDSLGCKCQFEVWYPGGRADLADPEHKIAVECGDTEPDKLLDALYSDWKFILVPFFQSQNDPKKCLAVLFVPNGDITNTQRYSRWEVLE
jgi:hypothetical protein